MDSKSLLLVNEIGQALSRGYAEPFFRLICLLKINFFQNFF